MKMLHVNLHFFKLKYNCFTVLVSVTFLHGNNFLKSFISSVSLDSGNEDPRVPSKRKKSLYTDGFSKPGKNKTASTTPSKLLCCLAHRMLTVGIFRILKMLFSMY